MYVSNHWTARPCLVPVRLRLLYQRIIAASDQRPSSSSSLLEPEPAGGVVVVFFVLFGSIAPPADRKLKQRQLRSAT